MAKIGSGAVVTGLTLGALAAIAALAVQAKGTEQHPRSGAPAPSTAASAPSTGSATPRHQNAPAVPAGSGSGKRVVYSLAQHRVWLVDPGRKPQVVLTFTVQPSTVDPAPGTYSVYGRTASGTGSDGKQIEHVVRFARVSGVVVGFSAAVDGTTPSPNPSLHTGGIRETRPDGQALWDFTATAPTVVVVA